MNLVPDRLTCVRFGIYELDLRAGELRKNGAKVRLQEQPFQVLAMLLERPGEVVPREEFQQKLWPDTFVDFEHSLNAAIKRLREALDDPPDNPRFVETVPRRGYRFIAPMERLPESPASVVALSTARRRWTILIPAAVLAMALAAVFFHFHRMRALTEKDSIVLTDFANSTGDSVFDNTLKQALAAELQQSPFLNILSDQRVRETLRLMGRAPGDVATEETARDVCQRAGSKAVLAGSIASLGRHYVIGLNAVNCMTGDSLAREEIEAASKEEVLKALDQATTKLRGKLGESLSSIQRFDTPIEQATTPSLEALKAYSLGNKTFDQSGGAAAIPYFMRAIQLDANFASAYAGLGLSYGDQGEPALASENLQKAYALRDRVSELEKFRITAFYYQIVTGELEKANQTCKLWIQAYPRDDTPWNTLVNNYAYLGQYGQSLAGALESLRLDPDDGIAYGNLVGFYLVLNRLDEAKATYRQALARKLSHPGLYTYMYAVAFLEGDTAEMQRQLALNAGNPGAVDAFFSVQSDTEAFSGRLGRAREFSRRAVESARRSDEKETAALWQMNAALREAEFGNLTLARQETSAALALVSTRDVQILAALALGRAGDSTRAQAIANDLAKRFPLHAVINGYWLPTIRGAIEINLNNPSKAIELLQAATAYELGMPLPEFEVGGLLYPVYVRGQAYLLLHRGTEAAAEFQKFLDHRSITVNCPLGALAHLGLARAYALQGDAAKARAAYQDFFTLWKEADPATPILEAAKSEYASLK